MPWPRLNTNGPLAEHLQDLIDAGVERGPAGNQQKRVKIALHGQEALEMRTDIAERQARIATDRIDMRRARIVLGLGTGAAREADDRDAGCRSFDGSDDAPGRVDAPALELVLRQAAGPAVEDLQGPRAGFDLAFEVTDRALDQEVDQRLEQLGL